MDVTKSTRHHKIIGDYGEMLVCNWLSRSGFEVTLVDHTGIDVVAYDPSKRCRLGITVKSRTRNVGKEKTYVRMFDADERQKIQKACTAFACEPWVAVYVETAESADLYLTSLEHYDAHYRSIKAVCAGWKMRARNKGAYDQDPDVAHIRFSFAATNWPSPVRGGQRDRA